MDGMARVLVHDGITVVTDERSQWDSPKGCWTFVLHDPINNHYELWDIYERYAERAGLKLFAIDNNPNRTLVVITVYKPRKES